MELNRENREERRRLRLIDKKEFFSISTYLLNRSIYLYLKVKFFTEKTSTLKTTEVEATCKLEEFKTRKQG
tara:strand:+ start:1034 stop:1246 length:213 start_codon:yes stop_codon:yes gene_type:complete